MVLTRCDVLPLSAQKSILFALPGLTPPINLARTAGRSSVPPDAGVRVRTLEYTDDCPLCVLCTVYCVCVCVCV